MTRWVATEWLLVQVLSPSSFVKNNFHLLITGTSFPQSIWAEPIRSFKNTGTCTFSDIKRFVLNWTFLTENVVRFCSYFVVHFQTNSVGSAILGRSPGWWFHGPGISIVWGNSQGMTSKCMFQVYSTRSCYDASFWLKILVQWISIQCNNEQTWLTQCPFCNTFSNCLTTFN